ncbi:MAG: hypothetical protein LBP76_08910 [Treponema sp.]|jgi:hypothetical protein|nr:hypothetical protein [Treponema sp.]
MPSSDWIPAREQDVVDLSEKWNVTLSDTAKQTAFGWDAAECAAVVANNGAPLSNGRLYVIDQYAASFQRCTVYRLGAA